MRGRYRIPRLDAPSAQVVVPVEIRVAGGQAGQRTACPSKRQRLAGHTGSGGAQNTARSDGRAPAGQPSRRCSPVISADQESARRLGSIVMDEVGVHRDLRTAAERDRRGPHPRLQRRVRRMTAPGEEGRAGARTFAIPNDGATSRVVLHDVPDAERVGDAGCHLALGEHDAVDHRPSRESPRGAATRPWRSRSTRPSSLERHHLAVIRGLDSVADRDDARSRVRRAHDGAQGIGIRGVEAGSRGSLPARSR